MVSAGAFSFHGGMSSPFTPFATTLGIPFTFDATRGFPVAFASKSVNPKLSDRSTLGRTGRFDAALSFGSSSSSTFSAKMNLWSMVSLMLTLASDFRYRL